MSVENLRGGANVISGKLSVADTRFAVSVSAAYPGATAAINPGNGEFTLFPLQPSGAFEDADSADLLNITLTLKDGETLNSGDTVSAILDSVAFTFQDSKPQARIKAETATTTILKTSGVVGDISGDGIVGAVDLSYALTLFGKIKADDDWYTSSAFVADIDGDGKVDMADITAIAYLSIGLIPNP
jgi:hypothetical protein